MTKSIFSVIFLLSISTSSFSQGFYFTVGYGGNNTSLEGVNAVVENYNTTRTWLDKKMKPFGYLDGMSVCLGTGFNHAWFDMEMAFRGQKRKASGTDLNGNYGTRHLRLRNNMFAMTIGGIGGENNTVIGGGFRMDLGQLKLKSKVEYPTQKEDWSKVVDSHLILRIGPAVKLVIGDEGGAAIALTLNYGFDLLNPNVYRWDEAINHTDYPWGPPDTFKVRTNTFGFSVAFGIAGAT